MELMYPVAIFICLIISICIYLVRFNKNRKYTQGKKVANTTYIKETEYYKLKVKKYKILSNILKILSVCCIAISSILIARPITVVTKNEDKYNRDIMLCLDMSASQDEVNYEMIKKFKTIVKDIEGDRIGIIIFNTAPMVYCPLTDDYEYINERLDEIQKQIDIVVKNDGSIPHDLSDEEYSKAYEFWFRRTSSLCRYIGKLSYWGWISTVQYMHFQK